MGILLLRMLTPLQHAFAYRGLKPEHDWRPAAVAVRRGSEREG